MSDILLTVIITGAITLAASLLPHYYISQRDLKKHRLIKLEKAFEDLYLEFKGMSLLYHGSKQDSAASKIQQLTKIETIKKASEILGNLVGESHPILLLEIYLPKTSLSVRSYLTESQGLSEIIGGGAESTDLENQYKKYSDAYVRLSGEIASECRKLTGTSDVNLNL